MCNVYPFWICFQYFANSISRLLLPVDGAHAAACEEMAAAMSGAEGAAYKGLQQCIETVIAEVSLLFFTLIFSPSICLFMEFYPWKSHFQFSVCKIMFGI